MRRFTDAEDFYYFFWQVLPCQISKISKKERGSSKRVSFVVGQSGAAAVVEFNIFVVYQNDKNLTTEIKHSQMKTWNTGGDLLQNYLFLK